MPEIDLAKRDVGGDCQQTDNLIDDHSCRRRKQLTRARPIQRPQRDTTMTWLKRILRSNMGNGQKWKLDNLSELERKLDKKLEPKLDHLSELERKLDNLSHLVHQ